MKKAICLLDCLIGLAVLLSAAFAGEVFASEIQAGEIVGGEIRGRILIARSLTKKRVTVPVYQLRGIALAANDEGKRAIHERPVDEMSRTAVYLEGARQGAAAPPVELILTQKNKRFDPELMIVPVGSTVSFPNGDPIFHNVFSLSKARQFDLGNYPQGDTRLVRLDQTGIVQVYCHLHTDMNAAIVVAPSRWFAQPEEDGSFEFSGLEAGDYTVVVWHKSAGFFRKKVRVPETGTVSVSLTIPLAEGD